MTRWWFILLVGEHNMHVFCHLPSYQIIFTILFLFGVQILPFNHKMHNTVPLRESKDFPRLLLRIFQDFSCSYDLEQWSPYMKAYVATGWTLIFGFTLVKPGPFSLFYSTNLRITNYLIACSLLSLFGVLFLCEIMFVLHLTLSPFIALSLFVKFLLSFFVCLTSRISSGIMYWVKYVRMGLNFS